MTRLAMTSLLVSLSVAACQSAGSAKPQVASAGSGAAPISAATAAPAVGPRPAAALEPLAFMAGAWTQQQANGAVPFYEFTQVVAEKDRVVLRQMHVHGNFEPDPKRTEPMELVLERAGAGSATFVPVADPAKANAGPLAGVTYALDGADMLVLTVEPRAQEGKPAEAPLVFRMSRAN
ncbi:MAG: hypothetical protein ACKOEL_10200 [Planctomycetota bacterium]